MSRIDHIVDASKMVGDHIRQMGKMAPEVEQAYKEYKQAKIKYNEIRFAPALLNMGAVQVAPGVYRLGDWICYLDGSYYKNTRNNQMMRLRKFVGVE